MRLDAGWHGLLTLAEHAGRSAAEATRLASFGTGLLSVATAIGCVAAPPLAERFGRRRALGWYFIGMALPIAWTAVAFLVGLLLLPLALETRGQTLPD